MRAVLSGGVAMLLGATAACATESTSLRGSAGKAVTEAKEAKTLDGQLADVFHNATKGFNASGVLIPNATKGFNASGHFIPSATNGFNASGPLTTVPRSEQMAKTEALVAKPGLENETNLAAAHYGGYGPPVPLPPHYGGGGYGPPPPPPHGGGGYGPPPPPPHYGGGGYGPPPHGGGGYGPPPPPPPHYGGGGHGAHACIGRFCVAVNGRASSVVTEAEEAKTLHGQLADRIAPTATEGLHASGPAIPNATTGFNASGPLTTVLRSEPMAKKEALVAKPGLDNETNLAAAHGPPVPLPPHYGGGGYGTQLFPPHGGGGYGLPPQPPHYGGGGYGSPVPSHVPPLPHGGGWGGSTRGGGWGGSAHGGGYGGSGWQVR